MDDEVRYPVVYDALREVSQVAIGRFQEEIGEEAIPQQTRWQVADKPDGTSEQYQVYEPDYFKLVSSQKDVLAEIPGYEECVEALLSNELYREHLPRVTDDAGDEVEDPDYEDWVRIETLVRLLAYYLEEKDALVFDEEVFIRVYRDFEQYLAGDTVYSRSWAVLDRFAMAPDELVLGDGLLIREITDDERGFLTGRSREIMNPVSHREVHGDYVVEYEYQVPKDGGRSTTEVEETFDSVTLALKLFPQGGDVRYLSVISDQFSPFEGARHRFSEGEAVTPSLRASCDFSEEECDEFLAFWDDHRGQLRDPPETMNIALRRYADAFQRREPEDRLIDLVISLEALLLKSGERQELSYRLSQRGALLLADDLEEAREIRGQLKDAYNERSNVVHGVRDDVDRAYIGDVQELTRRCLLAMLEQAPRGRKEHASVLDVLDGEALDPR